MFWKGKYKNHGAAAAPAAVDEATVEPSAAEAADEACEECRSRKSIAASRIKYAEFVSLTDLSGIEVRLLGAFERSVRSYPESARQQKARTAGHRTQRSLMGCFLHPPLLQRGGRSNPPASSNRFSVGRGFPTFRQHCH